jgi:hypothetical protein
MEPKVRFGTFAAYSAARADIDDRRVTLHPTRPPIARIA